ncbi:MAG: hypothetical protein ABSH05_22510 [Bryobacteraceae bacterium]
MRSIATTVCTALMGVALSWAATGAGEPQTAIPALEARITALNQELLAAGGPPPAAAAIIAERSAALRALIQGDPARALALALPESTVEDLKRAYPQLASSLEERGEWSGPITELYADDFKNGASRRLLWLRIAEGELDLHFASGEPVRLKTGDQARVQGLRVGMTVAVVSASVTAPAPAASACNTTGEQKIAALMVTYPGVTIPSLAQAGLREMLFGTSGQSLDGYWREESYGKTWATGDVLGWLRLNQAYSCDDANRLANAALSAAASVADLSKYNRFLLFFPGPCDSYLGMGTVGCSAGFSFAWLPIDQFEPSQELQVTAHEGGHNFGLNEVMGRRYEGEALGAPNDAGVRTTYYDPFTAQGNFLGIMGHHNAREKWQLGWLGADEVTTVEQPGTYRIAPLASTSGGLKALKIRRGDLDAWLWAEYRQPTGLYESTMPAQVFTGALIHYEDSVNQDTSSIFGNTDLLDFTPSSQSTNRNDFTDAALAAAQSWSDPWTPESIAVTAADADGLTIQVGQDSCVTLSASSAIYGGWEDGGSVQVTAPSSCNWQVLVSPAGSWITLTSADSGTGNGTVSYQVAALALAQVRQGVLSIGRRTFQITQDGRIGPPSGAAVLPASGAGYVEKFSFVYTDQLGVQDIARAWAEFRDSGGTRVCSVFVDTSTGSVSLQDESGASSALEGALGSSTVLENGHCSVALSGVSLAQADGELFVRAPMTFKPEFDGAKEVRLSAASRTGQVGSASALGQWTVGELPGLAPEITAAGVVNAASYQGGAVAPGEIVAIFGTGLGPAQIAYSSYDATGNLGNLAGGTKVFFDGVQAPVIYALEGQVSAIVPYSAASGTKVRVEYQGRGSNEVTVPVAAAVPGIFRYPLSTQGVVVQEAGFNSDQLPVERGQIVWFYVTGEGQTVPAGVDGKLPLAPNWPAPADALTVTFGGVPGRVDFKGLVYAGVLQLNVWVPANAPVGSNVPLTVTVGGISSPVGTTIAVK